MSAFNLLTVEFSGGKVKNVRKESNLITIDFSSIRIGASNLAIAEATGHFDFGNKKITNMADPTAAQEAATKAYVDAVRVAARIIGNVAAASTADIDLATGTLLMIDGYQTVAGDKVLVKNQADPTENGVYVAAVGAWSRSADLDNSPVGEIYNGVLIAAILNGSTQVGNKYVVTSVGTGTDGLHQIGTDNITFAIFSAAADITAGNGIDITGDTVSVKHDGEGLTFDGSDLALELDGGTLSKSASGLKVAAAGITETELATSVAGDGLTGGGGTPLAVGAGEDVAVSTNAVGVKYDEGRTNDNAGSITVGQVVYIKTNGAVDLAQASTANIDQKKIGVVKDATIATTATGAIFINKNAKIGGYSGLTVGEPVYISEDTAGATTQDISGFATGTDFVYRVGFAVSATEIRFDPEPLFLS